MDDSLNSTVLEEPEPVEWSDWSPNSTVPVITVKVHELWIQLIIFYGIIGGLVSTTLSVMFCIGVIRRKTRTRFLVMIGFIAFARIGLGLQFMVLTIFRSLRTLGVFQLIQTRIVCHSIHVYLIFGTSVEMALLCTLVIDRLIAITAINYYRLLTTKSVFRICILEYISMLLIKLVPSYFGGDLSAPVVCINWNSFLHQSLNSFISNFDFIMVLLVLVLYFVLILYVRLKSISSNADDYALRRQLKLIPTLRNLVLMHCGLTLVSKLLLWLATVVPRHRQRLVVAGGCLVAIDLVANYIALIMTNTDIRNTVMWYGKKNKVRQEKGTMKTVPTEAVRNTKLDETSMWQHF